MPRDFFCRRAGAALFVAAALLSSAGKAESVRSASYDKVPHAILAHIAEGSPMDGKFQRSLTDSLGRCGISIQYSPAFTLAEARTQHFDTVLAIKPLSENITTITPRHSASNGVTLVTKREFEYDLVDVETQKAVWKQRIDYTNPNPAIWAEALFEQLIKDKMLGPCEG